MSECPYCQNTFEMTGTCADEFTMWQGLVGPYYYPYIDINGYLTWSNTGDLPNPEPVNIIGPPGQGVDIKGIVATYSDLPPSPDNGDVYLVGTEAPYDAYVYFEGVWTDIGDVSKGADGRGIASISKTGTSGNVDEYTITYTDDSTPTIYYVTNGVGVPSGGTTGQVLAKRSGTNYDTEWVNQSAGVDPATATPLMDGTAAVGTATKYAREDHVHPTDTSRQETLVSGTNIKTVGGQSLLGSGNIDAGGALYYTSVACSATTGDIATVSDANITADHVLAEVTWASPSAITTDVTWTTSSGSLVLNGTCTAATTANIVLVKKNN